MKTPVFALCFLAVAGSFAAVSAESFPYCRCIDYDESSSPYAVIQTSVQSDDAVLEASFTVIDKPAPEVVSECYDIIKTGGVEKIQFDTNVICRGKVKVFINGVLDTDSKVELASNIPDKAYIKALFKPNLIASGANITIQATGECASYDTLFATSGAFSYAIFNWETKTCCPTSKGASPPPPLQGQPDVPPPPPPISGFPFCPCDSNTFDTPFIISNVIKTETDTANVYKLVLSDVGCDINSPCCGMDLAKIEFHVPDRCRRSVLPAVIDFGSNQVVRAASFGNYGVDRLVYKINRLGLTFENSFGVTVSFSLKKDSLCPDLETFLSEAKYALFSSDNKCCPVFDLPAVQ